MSAATDRRLSRWSLVVLAAAAMGMAGTYQFGWSSIRIPLGARLGAPEASLGLVFTLFVTFQTLAQFPAGWVRDRFGPRAPLAVGAIALGAGYVGTATATSLGEAALFYSLGGAGSGAVYTVAVNTPVKWFDERRGFATGVVSMAYSGVSFLLIPLLRRGVAAGFARTLLSLGIAAAIVALAAAAVLRDPDGGPPDDDNTRSESASADAADSRAGSGADSRAGSGDGDHSAGPEPGYTWRETVRTWQFWLLYLVFVAVNGVGLMVIGKVVSFAEALSLSPAAATGAASAVALADAGGIVVIGGLSDRLGRERTIAAALVLCGASLAASVAAADGGLDQAFVLLVGAAAFFRSPAFSVFPSLVGDYYGAGHSSANYAALYTAKLWGGVFGGAVASALVVVVGWSTAFLLGAGAIALAGLAAVALRPP